MKRTGAHALWETLLAHDLTTVFGYPGGAIMPVYDALTAFPDMRHVLVRHEQGAAHMAEGWAKATGEVGVCMATSGPGATNLVTGLADAMLDSVPLLAITGNVARPLIGTDAFQEADITGITLPITKHNYLVKSAAELPGIVAEAIRIARSGRPGPVLVDIPKDVQLEAFGGEIPRPHAKPEPMRPSEAAIEAALEVLRGAKRPVLMVGGGSQHAAAEITEFARAWNLPTITTLMGLGVFPASDELWLGMPGMHGSVAANRAISNADVLVGIGLRFDDRVTGKVSRFAPHAHIVHVDIDAAEISKIVRAHTPVRGDAGVTARRLAQEATRLDNPEWHAKLADWKTRFIRHDHWSAGYAVKAITERLAPDDILSTDVGQHQMLSAQLARFEKPRRWLTSGGLGTMGFGFPAAIGAAMAQPFVRSVVIAGDGGFQMTAQELATLTRYKVPVKIAVINNSFLGMVRQWQELFHERRYSEVYLGGDNPDFVKLAGAYNIHGLRASNEAELPSAIDAWLSHDGPSLLEVVVPNEHGVFPMVPAGAALDEMVETAPQGVAQ
ncbi:biosynthetic-type acetolactate synthase large subunit [Deinococcus yavapaiensis]|uniref:Acetolactate synthase n=1 Tax=Deinococcus yavapaiensis KR-236 TaxID=694435 RepID=A0A318SC52_9DEIO|nr:biosynthetic-type acetolactate synthase large subunit [Deinococcus yavapaiensis]PYE56411.1 acetolactate synthase large subunit [Deinococcus yavapaiensis KR-236]